MLIFALYLTMPHFVQVPEDHVKIINPHPAVPDKDHLLSRLIHFIFTSLLLGDFPFLCVFVQVLYVFDSLWYVTCI